jgi:hypothetical protein
MSELFQRVWLTVDRGVDQLTVNQTAMIGGAGSGVSLATATGLDHGFVDAWLQTGALGLGVLGGILSVGLMVMKAIQQRRE